ncbi:NUDIX domain-containing protein [Candidatus Woesearchaeota archaeon]|nr:NUDIX domain-containing protein [Candidatus Woesearchaeota archaeon]
MNKMGIGKEMVDYYSYEGELIGSMEKKKMHEKMRNEYFKKGKVSVRHKHVRLILMTSKGRVILQKRSKWKGDNPGMWDKTIGGHVTSGDSYDLTMLKECAEELGIPATIVSNEEFKNAVAVTDLQVLGVLTPLTNLDNYQSTRGITDKEKWIEPHMTQFYIGYYDGHIKFIDKEACGIQIFDIDELKDDLKKYPKTFTEDMKYIVKKFKHLIKPAPKKVEHVLND